MTAQADDGNQGTQSTQGTAEATSTEDFQRLLTSEARFAPSPEVLANANVKDYQALYDEADRDLSAFWDKIAREFTWDRPWEQVLEGQAPDAKWFVGGQLNITTNCLDRHANGSRANKKALIWAGEDGKERIFTFSELLAFT